MSAISVRHLARSVLGRGRGRVRRVAVLSTYLDGGGSVGDPSAVAFSVAGYLGTDEQWGAFEADWQAVLDEFRVPAFSMKHLAHFKKAFAKWKGDDDTRARFLGALARVIHRHDLEGFAYSLNLVHYRELDKHIALSESFPPYAVAASFAAAKIIQWQRRYRPNDSLLFLFELGDVGQGPFKHKMETQWHDVGIMKPVFMPKEWVENGQTRYCLPFQAADFLAYENNKTLSDFLQTGKVKVRKSFFGLGYDEGIIDRQPTNGHLAAPQIVAMAKQWRIPRRG